MTDYQDELVSFETALLAKEKGFKWEVIFAYDEDRNRHHRDYIPHDYNSRGLLSAPTQTMLARWLREIYNIDLWFGMLDKPNKYHVEDILKDDIIIGGISVGSEKWEHAHERGLFEALKLL